MTIDLLRYDPQRTFLIQGNEATSDALARSLEERFELVHLLSVPRFTIDHAHQVARFALEGDGTDRIFVIYFDVFSSDAAQALLKALEEPDLSTTIVLMTPHPYVIPLTIRSRVLLLTSDETIPLQKPITKQQALTFVKEELSGESDDDAATRRAKAISFLDTLETQVRNDRAKVSAIYEGKNMLFRANMPTKYVAEYVVTAIF